MWTVLRLSVAGRTAVLWTSWSSTSGDMYDDDLEALAPLLEAGQATPSSTSALALSQIGGCSRNRVGLVLTGPRGRWRAGG